MCALPGNTMGKIIGLLSYRLNLSLKEISVSNGVYSKILYLQCSILPAMFSYDMLVSMQITSLSELQFSTLDKKVFFFI